MSNVIDFQKYRPHSSNTFSYYVHSNGKVFRPKVMVDELAFCLGMSREEIEAAIREWYDVINKRSNT